jgi:hypothetical protein
MRYGTVKSKGAKQRLGEVNRLGMVSVHTAVLIYVRFLSNRSPSMLTDFFT